MTGIATKVQIGTAACAIAAAAVLTPAAVAQADPVAPVPISALGARAGAVEQDCDPAGSPDCASPGTFFAPNFSASSLLGLLPTSFRIIFGGSVPPIRIQGHVPLSSPSLR